MHSQGPLQEALRIIRNYYELLELLSIIVKLLGFSYDFSGSYYDFARKLGVLGVPISSW